MKKKNTFLRVGLVLTALVVGFIVLGLFWTPYSPNAMDFSAHPMGTDKFGRDILSRVMVGAGDTLLIALGTVAIGTVVGTLIGALTGWYGGWVDEVLMRLNDALASFPSILILLVLVSLLGGGIVFIPSYARIVRSEFARARTQNYVHSAELMGASTARILFVHILPNIWHTLVSAITIGFNNAVLAEAAMSYLSIGVSPDEASLLYALGVAEHARLRAVVRARHGRGHCAADPRREPDRRRPAARRELIFRKEMLPWSKFTICTSAFTAPRARLWRAST